MEDLALNQWKRAALVLAFAVLSPAAVLGDQTPADFFQSTNLAVFRVDLDDAELRQLAERPKSYACGKVIIGEHAFADVGVRLKGTGTFEPIYARPSLTLKFNWKNAHQQFAGLSKLFLENSGQDASRLCKLIANGAFADGGVPAPRITQARVELNGRDLGFYVVSEVINKAFLQRHFGNAVGNLYEAEFRDVDVPLKQENGTPYDQSDLRAVCAAARLSDSSQRKEALNQVLQTDEFLNFLAIEMIVANWDGYAFGQNNYRLYHDPASGRMSVIPHDLDNTLSESGMGLMPPRKSILTSALLETAQERAAFRERVAGLIPRVLDPERIAERVQASVARLSQGATPEQIEVIQRQAAVLQQRVQERLRHLREEVTGTRPPTPVFDSRGVAALEGWIPKTDWNNALLTAVVEDGKPCLSIQGANHYCFGSWRLPLWLPAGGYRFEASAKTRAVAGLPSRTGSGAGVRIVGNRRGAGLQDSRDWAPLRHSFVVQEDCEYVELIAELRAYTGTAWFDSESLKLIRVR